MATSSVSTSNAMTKQHGTVTITDGAALSIVFDDVGDFTCDGLQESNKAAVSVKHRGSHKAWVFADEEPLTGGFSVTMAREEWTHATDLRPMDFLRKTGSAGSATTTNAGSFGPMTYTLLYRLSAGGEVADLSITKVRLKGSVDESGDTVVLSFTYEGYGVTPA